MADAVQSRERAYLELLHRGLVLLRNSAQADQVELCRVEADHLHNIPTLLGESNEHRHVYYIEGERGLYLERLRKLGATEYQQRAAIWYWEPWQVLAAAAGVQLPTADEDAKRDAAMPSEQERALRERVTEQSRLEQARDVRALCDLILPQYRASDEVVSRLADALGQFVDNVGSAELVSFEVERWQPTVERFGGAPAAVVRSAVRYNESPEPKSFRTIWVCDGGEWYTTAVGKLWPGEPSNAPPPKPKPLPTD